MAIEIVSFPIKNGDFPIDALDRSSRVYDNWRGICTNSFSPFFGLLNMYPLVNCNSLLLNMAIEIVSFPMKNGDFP
jgi:hypothetical protein